MSGTQDDTHGTVWVVTDQLPYPPRNGLTLPLFHYITELLRHGPVKLLLFVIDEQAVDVQALAANEARFGSIAIIGVKRRGWMRRVVEEVLGRQMYHLGWSVVRSPDLSSLPPCTALLISPFSAVAKSQNTDLMQLPTAPVMIAGVHDCASAEFWFRPLNAAGGARQRAKAKIDQWRIRWIAAIEARLLQPFDTILMQTPRDRELLAELVSESLSRKVALLPNGVSDHYFKMPMPRGPFVIFVAELSGEYAAIANWLVKDVWPHVHARHPDFKLLVVGRGADARLLGLMRTVAGVQHQTFVEDLATVYQQSAVAISPVFKGFGLINKTLEAMACGLPVVGGLAAFNGIKGFRAGDHGVICENPRAEAFISAINQLLSHPEKREEIGAAARQLLSGQFHWDANARKLMELVHGIRSATGEFVHEQI
jgi:polysaccharide biosynthesis protein PslH